MYMYMHVPMVGLSYHMTLMCCSCDHQVSRLLELLELWMIHDTIRHVAQLHHLMLAERHRDEATLPLDLWKTSVNVTHTRTHTCVHAHACMHTHTHSLLSLQPSMKEPAGVPRPHIVADFLSQFQSSSTDMGPAYTIPKVYMSDLVNE